MGMEEQQLSPGVPWESSSRDCYKEGLFTRCLGGRQCLQPMLCCPGVLSRCPMTSGPEDLLPMSVLPDIPLSPRVRGSEGQPVTLRNCTGLTSVWARQAAPSEVCVGAKIRQQKPAGFAEPGEEESTSTAHAALPSGASAQLRLSFL